MISAFYIAILSLIYLGLTFYVIRFRRSQLISLGDGEYKPLRKAIRAHANFIEYTPLFIIMFYICETQGLLSGYLHIFGLGFVIGRILHPIGIMKPRTLMILRQNGMILTLLSYIGLISTLLIKNIPVIF